MEPEYLAMMVINLIPVFAALGIFLICYGLVSAWNWWVTRK